MNKIERIKFLYNKYIDREISSQEYEELFDLLLDGNNLNQLKSELDGKWQEIQPLKSPLTWEEMKVNINEKPSRSNIIKGRMIYWAAASVLILISLFFWPQSPKVEYEIYQTGYGEVNNITLDDGTKVVLNANSILKWQKDWRNIGVREVIIEGEGYFDVAGLIAQRSKKKLPFRVLTNDLTVNVVGTMFNIKNRGHQTDVLLDEGEVRLKLNKPGPSDEILLSPGQALSYSMKSKDLKRIATSEQNLAAWKEGTLEYKGVEVREIFRQLSEVFGLSFEVDDEDLLQRKITAGLPYTDWSIVKQSLGLILGVSLEDREGKVYIK
ncbi:FecR family protein [Membranihabitans marinus]|uniref:FecR family protein n=1 Tax=Membranihabitans marinus TaxID=1227546 RepID=UPI001F43202B|nr:FecR domain-containing protein [Membranihabitans marinus]